MFGYLQKGSFRKTENGWVASYRHPTSETSAEIVYNDMLEVNFSWRGEKWMAIAQEQIIYGRPSLYLSSRGFKKALQQHLSEVNLPSLLLHP
jgi:hypothetical protein